MIEQASAHVEEPVWTEEGLDLARTPRYPLQVETEVRRAVDSLVPGVTAVTPHARYFALHGLVWAEAERRGLDEPDRLDLVRRAEVVIAGASLAHEDHDLEVPTAHGADRISTSLDDHLDLDRMSRPGGYAEAKGGFSGPYTGAERYLGITSQTWPPVPGPRFVAAGPRSALGTVFELAMESRLPQAALRDAAHLCVCRSATSEDGAFTADLLVAPPAHADFERPDRARTATVAILLEVVRAGLAADPIEAAFGHAVSYGDFASTSIPNVLQAQAGVWRGMVLRNHSVSAWRRIWAWLVTQLREPATEVELGDRFAGALPSTTVANFFRDLPSTRGKSGLLSAEVDLRPDQPTPVGDLRILGLGARRLDELDGPAFSAFCGERDQFLGPEWFAARVSGWAQRSLQDFGRELAIHLLRRSRRVAMSKLEIRADGTLWLPTRVIERDGVFTARSDEGWGDVGLRIGTLANALLTSGVLSWRRDVGWSLGSHGVNDVG